MELVANDKQVMDWDYNQSVARMQPKVTSLRGLTLEIAQELSIAKKALSAQGRRLDLEDNFRQDCRKLDNGEEIEIIGPRTWEEYLEDIGLRPRTARHWLERYVPEEQRLLESEELKQLKLEKKEALYKKHRKMAKEYIKHGGIKPDGWNSKTEKIWEEEMGKKGRLREVAQQKLGNVTPMVNFGDIDPKKIDEVKYTNVRTRHIELLPQTKEQDPEERKHVLILMAVEDYINSLPTDKRKIGIGILSAKVQALVKELTSQEVE